jgi:ABC-2 type transport system ATP-binding protein
MIEVRNLTKIFGPIRAVDDISFQVGKGEVLGFLGPNGAGKTTTMKMITCFLEPTSGTASVCGFDILNDPLEIKKRVGYLSENAPAYAEMTVSSFLKFVADARGFKGEERKKALQRVLDLCSLGSVYHQTVDTLSKGYMRRLGLAQALIHDPEVLILDEPTDGLDPNQKHEIRNLIRKMAPEKCIILSTHILEEVEAVCSRAIIISRGRILADGSPEELKKKSMEYNMLVVRFQEPVDEQTREKLGQIPDVEKVDVVEPSRVFKLYPKEKRNIIQNFGTAAREQAWKLEEVRHEEGRLDEVFRMITQ